jgi:hypothetical protein
MATYKFLRLLSLDHKNKFDVLHDPGVNAPYPGIYRCEECGKEIAIAHGHPLPPESHHSHAVGQEVIVQHDSSCFFELLAQLRQFRVVTKKSANLLNKQILLPILSQPMRF